jgi:hypothetical protein
MEPGLKLVPTKHIRKIAPEILSRTTELKRLSDWRQTLAARRKKLEHLRLNVQQMDMDLMEEERNWEAEADRLANVPFHEIEEVISIGLNDAAAQKKTKPK